MSEVYLTYEVTLSMEDMEVLQTVLEDTLHQHTEVASIEDAVIRGVLKQITDQWYLEGLKGSPS